MIFFLLVWALFPGSLGALAGVLASFFLRLPIRGVWKDALLGLVGFPVFVVMLVSRLGTLLIGTRIDPNWVGLAVAALCPVVRQVVRLRNARASRTTSPQV